VGTCRGGRSMTRLQEALLGDDDVGRRWPVGCANSDSQLG
jgi:hypothetical protein